MMTVLLGFDNSTCPEKCCLLGRRRSLEEVAWYQETQGKLGVATAIVQDD